MWCQPSWDRWCSRTYSSGGERERVHYCNKNKKTNAFLNQQQPNGRVAEVTPTNYATRKTERVA
uniref:Uncharacterized protein n=1 Tax=Anopheles quadriannulatus TaxID=34691 RepID=A0A182XTB0_ANOQN